MTEGKAMSRFVPPIRPVDPVDPVDSDSEPQTRRVNPSEIAALADMERICQEAVRELDAIREVLNGLITATEQLQRRQNELRFGPMG